MDFIKYIDFFSIKFFFYINNQPNYQNVFGGIMTFLYVVFCVIIFISFSLEDIKGLNPITTKNEIPYHHRKLVDMINENIYIPFRIVNYENQFVDHRGGLFIVPYLIEGKLDDKIGMDLKAQTLNYKFCNETSMAHMPKNYRIDTPLNQLFCIDKDNITFGGNWNEKFLNYIEINLYLCEEGISYNSSDPRCDNLEKLLKKANSSLLFDFYFPIVQFQPTNLDNPVKIIYKNYYYRLTSYSYKVQKLYLLEHILSDDRNMVSSKYKNTSYWGMSSLYADDYFLPSNIDLISNNSNTSRIYALNIYMDDGLVYYTRTFKKIFLIIANIFPLFNLGLYIMRSFTQYVKMSFTKRKLTGLIFENVNIKSKKLFPKKIDDINTNYKAKKSNKNNKIQLSANKSENELMKDRDIKKKDKLFELNNTKRKAIIKNMKDKKHYSNNNIMKNSILFNNRIASTSLNDENLLHKKGKQISSIHLHKNKLTSIYDIFKEKESFDSSKNNIQSKKEKYLFPYYYYFMDFIFDNIINPRRFFCISRTYLTVYYFMCNIYDISTHLILFKHYYLLNNIIKDKICKENDFDYKFFNAININDHKMMETLSKNLKIVKNRKPFHYTNYFL